VCLIKLTKLLRWQQLNIMQQFGASAFYTVVRWHKLGEVDSEYISHNSIVLAIRVPKIIKFGRDLTKFWQKQVRSFFGPLCIHTSQPLHRAQLSGVIDIVYHSQFKKYPEKWYQYLNQEPNSPKFIQNFSDILQTNNWDR